jgi:cell division protein ZapA
MGDFTISVKIAERTYKMTIDPEEEENVRRAAKLINEKLKEYGTAYAFNDIQDLLSMVALQFASSSVKSKDLIEKMDDELSLKLTKIDDILTEQLP